MKIDFNVSMERWIVSLNIFMWLDVMCVAYLCCRVSPSSTQFLHLFWFIIFFFKTDSWKVKRVAAQWEAEDTRSWRLDLMGLPSSPLSTLPLILSPMMVNSYPFNSFFLLLNVILCCVHNFSFCFRVSISLSSVAQF